MRTATRSILGFSLVTAFVWLAGLGAADAIVIRGRVDPAFSSNGSTTDGLDWTADIVFDVGPECLVPDSTDLLCGSVTDLSVTGTLTFNSETIPLDFLETSPPAPTISLDVDSSGTAFGIGTSQIGPASWAFTFPTLGSGFAWIRFDLPNPEETEAESTARLLLQFCDDLGISTFELFSSLEWECTPSEDCVATSPTATSDPATVVVTQQVPEPGMLWLVFAALSTVWLMRRRQQLN